jgi:cell division protein FtsB
MDFPVNPRKISQLASPEKGLHLLADQAPRAEAFAQRIADRLQPAATWFYHSRRRLATAAIALLAAWLFLHVMFGANGMVVYRQKRAEYQDLQKDVEAIQKANQQSSAHVKALKEDPKAIEQEAREQLHYAKPGEVIYVAPPPPPPAHPTTDSARK